MSNTPRRRESSNNLEGTPNAGGSRIEEKDQLQTLNSKLASYIFSMRELRERIAALEKEKVDLKEHFESELRTRTERIQSQLVVVAERASTADQMRAKASEASDRANAFTRQNDELQQRLDQLLVRFDQLEAAHRGCDRQIKRLQQELEASKTAQIDSDSKRYAAETLLASAQDVHVTELDKLTEELAQLNDKVCVCVCVCVCCFLMKGFEMK
jgi:chromosome segregation ATPase